MSDHFGMLCGGCNVPIPKLRRAEHRQNFCWDLTPIIFYIFGSRDEEREVNWETDQDSRSGCTNSYSTNNHKSLSPSRGLVK